MTDPHIPPNIDFDEDGNVKRSKELEALIGPIPERQAAWVVHQGHADSAHATIQSAIDRCVSMKVCRNCGREIVTEEGCAW